MRASDAARCLTCQHPERAAIEVAMIAGHVGIDTLAARYGISRDSLARHKRKHCEAIVAKLRANELEQVESAKYREQLDRLRAREERSVLVHLVALRTKLQLLGDKADAKNDINTSAKIQSRLLAVVTTIGTMMNSFADSHARVINQNLTISPDYIRLRAGLISVLRKHPGALKDVLALLSEIESVGEVVEKPQPKLITAASVVNDDDAQD